MADEIVERVIIVVLGLHHRTVEAPKVKLWLPSKKITTIITFPGLD